VQSNKTLDRVGARAISTSQAAVVSSRANDVAKVPKSKTT